MTAASDHALQIETEYLAGVQTNLAGFAQRLLRGAWFERGERDAAEAVRAALIDHRVKDPAKVFKQMPLGRSIMLRGFERRWFFGRRETSRTIATVLAPPGPLLEADGEAPPVTLAELREHVRRMTEDRKGPTLVAVCSPSGFEPDAWTMRWDQPGVRVILAEPRGSEESGSGWRVKALWDGADERLVRLFDPERAADKLKRIRNELESCGGDLLTGGVSAQSLAERLDLPPAMIEQALEMISRADPELRVSRSAGELLVFRGAAVDDEEADAMSVTDWIRSLFSKKGDEGKKINMLSERRARLAQRRDRLYEDIGRLETKEGALTEEGKKNASPIVRRRLAAQIAQLRRDIARHNTTAAMLNQQMNVISTHIHNLTLIQQGQTAQLPSSEELTEDAVRAEEMLETLRADAELVGNLETGVAVTMLSDDEAAILKEFEASDAAKAVPAVAAPTAAPAREKSKPPETARAAEPLPREPAKLSEPAGPPAEA